MINLDLDEIKRKTSNPIIYSSYYNWYRWKEIEDLTKNKEFKEVPLFDVPLSKLSKDGKISILHNSEYTSYVCFGRFTVNYSKRKAGNKSRILFEITPYLRLQNSTTNNHCWMNEEQLDFWIKTLQEESGLDFFYKITKDESRYHIFLDFKELSRVKMKYILFWIRYAYEYPASFCALDAMLLKRDFYPEETMQNLLTLTGISQRNNRIRINYNQCITVNGNFIQKEWLRKRLNTVRNVSSLFGHPGGTDFDFNQENIYGVKIPKFINNTELTGDIWLSHKERFDFYNKLYPVMKKHELKEKKIKEEK